MTIDVSSTGGLPYNYGYLSDPYMDIEDLDPTYSTYPGMGGSIFSMSPMMYGGGMLGGMGPEYFNQMKDYQKFFVDYNVDQQKLQRNADLRINGSMEAIQSTYNALKDKIDKNEQGQIEEAYNNFVNAVKNAYGQGTPAEVKARASSIYSQLSGGKTLVQDLRSNSHGSFVQGVINSLAFGLYDRRSAEDNISAITGSPVSTGDKTSQNMGRLIGAGAVGLMLGAIGSKIGGKTGRLIGLGAGVLSAIMSFATGKVTT